MGNEKPGGFGSRGSFEVFGQASASSEPREGAFDNPSPRQELEALDALRSLHDLDLPRTAMSDSFFELLTSVDPIRKDMAQFRESVSELLQ
jgi:hypothetical protein